MDPIVRAIDVGWGNTKYVTKSDAAGIKCAHFPSIAPFHVSDKASDSIGEQRRTITVPIDGLFYEVGPDAALAVDRYRGRHLHDGYTQTAEYRALMAGALAYMKTDVVDLLVVGLPVSQFASRRAALEKAMTGTFTVGKKKKVEVKRVLAVAQPQGALYDYAVRNGASSLENGRSLVVDVGSRTFDWLLTRGIKVITKMSNSTTRGVSDILIEIANRISADIREEFRDLDKIDVALRSGRPMRIYQKDYELKQFEPLIQKIADQAVGAMVQTMDSTHDIENVVLVGGGAPLFKRAIVKQFPRHEIHEVPEPLFANVRGFQRIGESFVKERPELFGDMESTEAVAGVVTASAQETTS